MLWDPSSFLSGDPWPVCLFAGSLESGAEITGPLASKRCSLGQANQSPGGRPGCDPIVMLAPLDQPGGGVAASSQPPGQLLVNTASNSAHAPLSLQGAVRCEDCILWSTFPNVWATGQSWETSGQWRGHCVMRPARGCRPRRVRRPHLPCGSPRAFGSRDPWQHTTPQLAAWPAQLRTSCRSHQGGKFWKSDQQAALCRCAPQPQLCKHSQPSLCASVGANKQLPEPRSGCTRHYHGGLRFVW